MQTVAQIDLYNHPEFLAVLHRTADCAREKMPEAEARILRASMLVMNGHVRRNAARPHGWVVASESREGIEYDVAENVCNCEDYERYATHTNGYACKHVLGVWLYRRVAQHVSTLPNTAADCWQPVDVDATPCHAAAQACTHQTPRIPPQFVVELHGKQFVQYAGLLAMAHEQGLRELSAEIMVHVPDVIAIAKATAVFADGRRFTESADATPVNVTAKIKPHFVRMALTRAKARALRDSLNIGMCSIEELE